MPKVFISASLNLQIHDVPSNVTTYFFNAGFKLAHGGVISAVDFDNRRVLNDYPNHKITLILTTNFLDQMRRRVSVEIICHTPDEINDLALFAKKVLAQYPNAQK